MWLRLARWVISTPACENATSLPTPAGAKCHRIRWLVCAPAESPPRRFPAGALLCSLLHRRMVWPSHRLPDHHAGERFVTCRTEVLLRLHPRLRRRERRRPERLLQAHQEGWGPLGPLWRLLVVHRKDQGHLYLAQHGPLLRRSGLQWPGRASHVHRIASHGPQEGPAPSLRRGRRICPSSNPWSGAS